MDDCKCKVKSFLFIFEIERSIIFLRNYRTTIDIYESSVIASLSLLVVVSIDLVGVWVHDLKLAKIISISFFASIQLERILSAITDRICLEYIYDLIRLLSERLYTGI